MAITIFTYIAVVFLLYIAIVFIFSVILSDTHQGRVCYNEILVLMSSVQAPQPEPFVSERAQEREASYSAGWNEEEKAKAGEQNTVSERFWTCKLLERKTGAPAASCFSVSRFLGGQAKTKEETLVHKPINGAFGGG
jgi:hypothetical protein